MNKYFFYLTLLKRVSLLLIFTFACLPAHGGYGTYCHTQSPTCVHTWGSDSSSLFCTGATTYCQIVWLDDIPTNPNPTPPLPSYLPVPPPQQNPNPMPPQQVMEEVEVIGQNIQDAALTGDDLDWVSAYRRHQVLIYRAGLDGAAEAVRRGLDEQGKRSMVEGRRNGMCRTSTSYAAQACKSQYSSLGVELSRQCNGFATGVTASLQMNFRVFSTQVGVSGTDNMLACKAEASLDTQAAHQYCETDGIMFSMYAACP